MTILNSKDGADGGSLKTGKPTRWSLEIAEETQTEQKRGHGGKR